MQLTFYFKETHGDPTIIRERLTALAQLQGIGNAAGDLLAAIANGEVELIPTTPTKPQDDPEVKNLTLTQLLEQAAIVVERSGRPNLAAALRKKLWLIVALLESREL